MKQALKIDDIMNDNKVVPLLSSFEEYSFDEGLRKRETCDNQAHTAPTVQLDVCSVIYKDTYDFLSISINQFCKGLKYTEK